MYKTSLSVGDILKLATAPINVVDRPFIPCPSLPSLSNTIANNKKIKIEKKKSKTNTFHRTFTFFEKKKKRQNYVVPIVQ